MSMPLKQNKNLQVYIEQLKSYCISCKLHQFYSILFTFPPKKKKKKLQYYQVISSYK